MTHGSRLIVSWLTFGLFTLTPGPADADIFIDPNGSGGFSVSLGFFQPIGQTFVADVSAISWIGMFLTAGLQRPDDPPAYTLSLFKGEGFAGELVASRTTTADPLIFGYLYFDFLGTALTVGDRYTASIAPVDMSLDTGISGMDDSYAGGSAIIRGELNPGFDLFLRVLSTSEPPPLDRVPPTITISASRTTLWPPNGKMVPVTISGRIVDGLSGVNPSTLTYAVTDEYGRIQLSGPVTLVGKARSYSFTIQLQASREGSDRNGRQYTITVSAQDNTGNAGSASTVVTVPHDQGN